MAQNNLQANKKSQLLDQMLEDLAGDEFDEFDGEQNKFDRSSHRYESDDAMFEVDSFH